MAVFGSTTKLMVLAGFQAQTVSMSQHTAFLKPSAAVSSGPFRLFTTQRDGGVTKSPPSERWATILAAVLCFVLFALCFAMCG